MAVRNKNVLIHFDATNREFNIFIERENEKTQKMTISGDEARHLFDGLDLALNARPKSEPDAKDLKEHGDKPSTAAVVKDPVPGSPK